MHLFCAFKIPKLSLENYIGFSFLFFSKSFSDFRGLLQSPGLSQPTGSVSPFLPPSGWHSETTLTYNISINNKDTPRVRLQNNK